MIMIIIMHIIYFNLIKNEGGVARTNCRSFNDNDGRYVCKAFEGEAYKFYSPYYPKLFIYLSAIYVYISTNSCMSIGFKIFYLIKI